MKSLWNHREAKLIVHDPVKLRVYTSRLLGQESSLVLHGGGNTSVKTVVENIFGEKEEILYIKGSGWDLATIEAAGFAPVKMDVLKKMAKLESLSDSEMVKWQRAAMIDPNAPNPSVEAILHAIIPFQFVDHTHADAVVTITNTPRGEQKIQEIYGSKALIIPYVMPGFVLAKEIFKRTQGLDWSSIEAIILLNHGVFTFHDDAKISYENMIRTVTKAENYLKKHAKITSYRGKPKAEDLLVLANVRRAMTKAAGKPMLARLDSTPDVLRFVSRKDVKEISQRGTLTPDHVIRTKPIPAILGNDPDQSIAQFVDGYKKYFSRHNQSLTMLDPAPRWAVWPGVGTVLFGSTVKDVEIIVDITRHTMPAIERAEMLGGWRTLSEKDIFEMEYWELEQAKLKKFGTSPIFHGKVAIVTGAASGIGKACVETLQKQGAAVAALDINPLVEKCFDQSGVLGICCDVTNPKAIQTAINQVVRNFGGIDIVVSNAGTFPSSMTIKDMDEKVWQKSMDVNLTSHQMLIKNCLPYLLIGIDPAIIIVASKNVPAPGPGAGAYSIAKAGLTQLARIAALELADKGVRVNVIHPNQVFDTGIWTDDILKKRAEHYKLSVEQYKKSNLLKVAITSQDVAALVASMAGPVFSKTTGAQVPIDGGNERVI